MNFYLSGTNLLAFYTFKDENDYLTLFFLFFFSFLLHPPPCPLPLSFSSFLFYFFLLFFPTPSAPPGLLLAPTPSALVPFSPPSSLIFFPLPFDSCFFFFFFCWSVSFYKNHLGRETIKSDFFKTCRSLGLLYKNQISSIKILSIFLARILKERIFISLFKITCWR